MTQDTASQAEARANPNSTVFEDETFFSIELLVGGHVYLWQQDEKGEFTQINMMPDTLERIARHVLAFSARSADDGAVAPEITTEQQRAWAAEIMAASTALYCVEPPMRSTIDKGLNAALSWARAFEQQLAARPAVSRETEKLLELIETAHEHGDECAIIEQAATVRQLLQEQGEGR